MQSKDSKQQGKEASVIVLLEKESDTLILTKRSQKLRIQPGDICFPGGLREKADQDLLETGLRELNEELGIDSSRVHIIQKLEQETTIFNSLITPWYAEIDSLKPYHVNHHEVEKVIKVPIAEVINSNNYSQEVIKKYKKKLISTVFTYEEEFIWGVTARIMKQLSSPH